MSSPPGGRAARARHADEEVRYQAVAEMDPGRAEDRAVLLERLADPSWRVRAAVAERLGSAAQPLPVVGALIAALQSQEGIGAREAAGEALARVGSPALPALMTRLEDRSPDLRQAVASVIGRIGDRRAAAPLSALLADEDPNVRVAAAEALARVGGPAAAAALHRAVETRDPALRLAVVEALASLRSWPPGLPPSALMADSTLRRAAYRLLGSCDDPAAGPLVAAGVAEPGRTAREAALVAAGQQRSRRRPADLEPLASALRTRAAADPTLADTCASALASDDDAVAAGALAALGWIGGARHVRAILRLAEDDRHRATVEEVLASLPRGDAVRTALAESVTGLGPAARITALAELARLGSAEALESLSREAADAMALANAEAAAALRKLGLPRPVAGAPAAERAGATAAAVVPAPPPPLSDGEFEALREVIHGHSGLWFRDDMRYLVERRLGPRVQALGLAGFADYRRYLAGDPGREAELDEASELLTTNETYLFREPLQLGAFQREVLPVIARELAARRQLRVLSAGCSTGEEAWTVAALVRESGLFEGWDVEVIGVDLSRRCLAQARAGAYGDGAFRSPEAEPLRRWFKLRGGRWVVDDDLRRTVRFVRDNLLAPRALAAVSTLDVVFCRNVMIYFDADARRRTLHRLRERMRPGAWLLLGHSESLLNLTADFSLVHLRDDLVYRKPRLAAAEEDA